MYLNYLQMASNLLEEEKCMNLKRYRDPLTVGHRPTLNNNLKLLLR